MRRSLKRSTWLLPMVWTLTACAAAAQSVEQVSPQASLACFVESREAGLPGSECGEGVVPAEAIMMVPARYDPAVISTVVEGLEDLALTSDNIALRTGAVAWLGALGVADEEAGRPMPGSVERLAGLYERTTWSDTRDQVIKLMIHQDDRASALRFLADVARSDPGRNTGGIPPAGTAIWILTNMDSEGVAVLRQLHVEGSVTNPQAKASLERMAEADFQVKEH